MGSIAIVGCGAAGTALIVHLAEQQWEGIDRILIIDPRLPASGIADRQCSVAIRRSHCRSGAAIGNFSGSAWSRMLSKVRRTEPREWERAWRTRRCQGQDTAPPGPLDRRGEPVSPRQLHEGH